MTKEELEKATGQELIEERDYCGVDGYYGDYLDNVNAEMLKRFNCLKELEKHNEKLIALINAERERQEKCDDIHLRKIADLEKEITELKAVERMALYSRMSDRLAKAEELLLELYDCIPSSMADSCKETLQKVALFFKDSEVEK